MHQGLDSILTVLYGQKTPYNNQIRKVNSITKSNGTEIPMGLFTSNAIKEVSAIIFSTNATWGKLSAMSKSNGCIGIMSYGKDLNTSPSWTVHNDKTKYKESIGNGTHIFLNPFAEKPFNFTPFIQHPQHIGIWNYNNDNQKIDYHFDKGLVMSRMVFNLTINGS